VASDFTSIKTLFFERLQQRGYSPELISISSNNVILDRNTMLIELRNSREQVEIIQNTNPEPFRFIFQHNPRKIPFKQEGWGHVAEFVFQDQFSHLLFNKERPILFVKKNPASLNKLLC